MKKRLRTFMADGGWIPLKKVAKVQKLAVIHGHLSAVGLDKNGKPAVEKLTLPKTDRKYETS